ncbi:MAG: hypothetical protein KDD65_04600 [Bacteroidetes bacterium]|nr:hypothetical protein [Bacteroidota bacterium]
MCSVLLPLPDTIMAIRRSAPIALALLAAATSACRTHSIDHSTSLVSWTISEEPVLTIGEIEGEPEYLFGRVGDATRLSDGTIVVTDYGAKEVRQYDPNGRFIRSVGSVGEGPGQFDTPFHVQKLGGDFVVFDAQYDRYVRFRADGSHVDTIILQPADVEPPAPSPFQIVDSTLFAYAGTLLMRYDDTGFLMEDTVRYFHYDVDGALLGTISKVAASQRWGVNSGGVVAFPQVPFYSSPSGVASNGRFFFGSGRVPVVDVWTNDGKQVARIEWHEPIRHVDAALRRQFENYIRSEYPPGSRNHDRYEQYLNETYYPDSLPVYDDMLADPGVGVWIKRYSVPWDERNEWTVISAPAGQPPVGPTAEVSLPDRFKPLEVGPEYVLGVRIDEEGYQRIQVSHLTRTG